MLGGYYETFFIRADWAPLPYALIPQKPSWAELNRGKRSKRDRRK